MNINIEFKHASAFRIIQRLWEPKEIPGITVPIRA